MASARTNIVAASCVRKGHKGDIGDEGGLFPGFLDYGLSDGSTTVCQTAGLCV